MRPGFALVVVALTAAGFLCGAGIAWPAPGIPASDDVVLERLPARPGDPVQRELRELRDALARNPRDPVRAIELARRHFSLALAEGDPRHIGYAQAALGGLPEATEASAEVLVVRAQLAQYRHEFARALALLDRARVIEPDNREALSWSAAVRMVQADYAGALRDCEQLARTADELLGTACLARVAAATGSLRAAYTRLSNALARHPGARPTLKLWVTTLLADMAQRLDDPRAADAHYRAALALDERRPAEAALLLRGWERSDTLLFLIARAAKALGSTETPRLASTLKARYAAADQRGERLHAQDESRFRLEFLGDAAGALALASQNWTDQREAADARILLEAALAAEAPQQAQPALDWLASSGFEDARLARLAAGLKALGR